MDSIRSAPLTDLGDQALYIDREPDGRWRLRHGGEVTERDDSVGLQVLKILVDNPERPHTRAGLSAAVSSTFGTQIGEEVIVDRLRQTLDSLPSGLSEYLRQHVRVGHRLCYTQSGRYCVLVVDDEDSILQMGEQLFRRLGYEVLTAHNGQEALMRVKEHRPGLVFLDIAMPYMDGTEALQLIHEIDPDIQVVVVSGYATGDLARNLLMHGAADFIQKPAHLQHLRETVERLRSLQEL